MPWWLKDYGDTEGPLGFPMPDAEAKALDRLLADNPHAEYEQLVVEKATPSAALSPGERADVSWITTEAIDRQKEVVLTDGFMTSSSRPIPSSPSTTTTAGTPSAVRSGAASFAMARRAASISALRMCSSGMNQSRHVGHFTVVMAKRGRSHHGIKAPFVVSD